MAKINRHKFKKKIKLNFRRKKQSNLSGISNYINRHNIGVVRDMLTKLCNTHVAPKNR